MDLYSVWMVTTMIKVTIYEQIGREGAWCGSGRGEGGGMVREGAWCGRGHGVGGGMVSEWVW